MTTFMFPGQGSQHKGMGADFFTEFTHEIHIADEILGYSIVDLCLNDPQQLLSRTEYTQPALYVVESLMYKAKQNQGLFPDYCIGHSLGEYAALYAAGAFDFPTGLRLVQKRGSLMSQVSGGGMLAVVDLAAERIKILLESQGLKSIDFANFNSKRQIVLSGPAQDIHKAYEILSVEAMMCVPLNVSGAFHSRYMEKAAQEFAQFIDQFSFSELQATVIANVNAEPYTLDTIKGNLVNQITHPVLWTEIIQYVKNKGESEFVEVGPGNVLTRLLAQQ